MVIEQYKTGFATPSDIPFEDLSVTGSVTSSGTSSQKLDVQRGTVTGRAKKRTGLRALFNTTRVRWYCQLGFAVNHIQTRCSYIQMFARDSANIPQ